MKEYLQQLFQEDGVMIFHTDYHLFLKLLNKFSEEPLRMDAYCVNAILSGNAFYEQIVGCLKQPDHKLEYIVYNTFIDQMYSRERLWKKASYDAGHFEQLLRMLFEVASIDLSDIPHRIHADTLKRSIDIDVQDELESAEKSYVNGYYRIAFEKATELFANNVNEASRLLGMAYYSGKGAVKDYNKALFYLSYPCLKNEKHEKEDREIIEKLLEMRDMTSYSALVGIIGSVLTFLFMFITKFFFIYTLFAIVNTLVLIVGCVLMGLAYSKHYIFDFTKWFFLLGCMFLMVLIL